MMERQKQYIELLHCGQAFYQESIDMTMKVLYYFYYIRSARNNINHASSEVNISTEKITQLMNDTLNCIESVPGH